MSLSSNLNPLIVQRPEKILARQAAPKVSEWAIYGTIARSPKTRIFWKRAKGGPTEIFQKSPKKQPSFERANSTLAQMALPSNQYALKVQRLDMILALTTAPKVPEWQSYGNFWKVTQDPHFLNKCKGETNRNFSKIAQKKALASKGQQHSGASVIIL